MIFLDDELLPVADIQWTFLCRLEWAQLRGPLRLFQLLAAGGEGRASEQHAPAQPKTQACHSGHHLPVLLLESLLGAFCSQNCFHLWKDNLALIGPPGAMATTVRLVVNHKLELELLRAQSQTAQLNSLSSLEDRLPC